MARKRDPKNEPGTAAYYESRRSDLSEWSTEPVRANVAATGTVVVSIRMDVGEVEAVRRAAADYRMTVSDLVRSAILQSTYWKPAITVSPASHTRSHVSGVVQAMNPGNVYHPCTAGTQSAQV